MGVLGQWQSGEQPDRVVGEAGADPGADRFLKGGAGDCGQRRRQR